MCALLEKMVNLNKNKKRLGEIRYRVQWNQKILKNSSIQFFISKPAVV